MKKINYSEKALKRNKRIHCHIERSQNIPCVGGFFRGDPSTTLRVTFNRQKNVFIWILSVITAVMIALGAGFGAGQTVNAYNPNPTTATVDNLWNSSTKTFNRNNLNKMAQTLLGSANAKLDDLITAAAAPTKKKASDFGTTTIKLGNYKLLNGVFPNTQLGTTEQELIWIPTYLSQADNGDAILTLWLAGTGQYITSTTTYQEIAPFSDGTESYNGASGFGTGKTWHGTTVYSDTYDSSYIRNVVLNGNTDFAGGFPYRWNGSAHVNFTSNYHSGKFYGADPFSNQVYATNYNENNIVDYNVPTKFNILQSGGDLANFIVKPQDVSWQKNLTLGSNGVVRNDYGYSGTNSSAYPTAWMGDNIWLPSITEANVTWNTSAAQNANLGGTWTRSASVSNDRSHVVYFFDNTGTFQINVAPAHVQNWYGVRPAFHLNLSKIADYFVDTPSVSGTYTYNRDDQTVSFNDFDTSKVKIKSVVRTDSATTGFSFTDSVLKVKNAGEYTVEFETKTGTINGLANQQYIFNENDTAVAQTSKKIKFTVAKAKLQTPSFGSVATAYTKDYNGSEQIFTASNYPSTAVTSANPAYPRDPLSVAITKTNGAMIGSAPTAAGTAAGTATGTLEVKARNVGDYKATFTIADSVNYEWANGTGTKDALFYVKPKGLTLAFTTTKNNVWGWAADTSESGTITVSGLWNGDANFPADTVDVQIELTKDGATGTSYVTGTNNNDGTYTFNIDKNISAFGGSYTPGTYYLKPVLGAGSGGTHDGNYSFDTALGQISSDKKGYKLVITAASAGLTNYTLQYDDGNGVQPMPTGNKLTYKLNTAGNAGVSYTVTLDTSSFPSYLSVDSSYNQNGFTGGYKNNVAANAGNYTTTVHLKSSDPAHLFANGTQADDVTVNWEIEKATFTLTGAKWQYTDNNAVTKDYPATWNDTNGVWDYAGGTDAGIPWYGESYTLSITGLPVGITVNSTGAYNGNKQKFIGSGYQAQVTLTFDTANFNALPSAFNKLAWKIVKGKVEITSTSWTTQQGGSGTQIYYVPTLQNVNGVVYEYYDLGTDETNFPDPSTLSPLANGLSDVTYTQGTKHYYLVKAVVAAGVSTDGTTLWSDAIEIVDTTSGETVGSYTVPCAKKFETGDDRTPVQVTLNGAPFTYDKQPHGVLSATELTIKTGSTDFDTSKFEIKYFVKDTSKPNNVDENAPLAGAPTVAGEYVIVIQLIGTAADDYYVTAKYVEYEIKPYVLDMSQVKWGYIDDNGDEVAYNPSLPPQFTLDANGDPVEHKLVLIGLPKGDANGDAAAQLLAQMFADSGLDVNGLNPILSYTGNTGSNVTNSGSLTARCDIDTNQLSKNLTLGSLPFTVDGSGIATATQQWNIDPKKINTPKSDNTHDFTGNVLDILSFAGLDPAGLGVYYKLTGLTKRDEQNNTQSLFTSETCANPNAPTLDEVKAILAGIKDAGRYGITVEIIDKNNVKFVENGVIGTLPTYSAQITVNKLKVQVVGWVGDGNSPFTPNYASSSYPPNVVESKFTLTDGTVVAAADLVQHYNEQFKQTIVPVSGNENNVEVEFINSAESEKQFLMLNQANPPDPLTKPDTTPITGGTYTGGAQSFMPAGLETLVDGGRVKLYSVAEDGTETPVGKEYFTQTNAGKYKVVAKIEGNYYWDDGNGGSNYDKTPIEYEFEIEKAKIEPVWKLDGKGKPVASMPAGITGVTSPFDYHYFDENGNEVPEKKLVADSTYTVGVSLKDAYKDNMELVDASGVAVAGGIAKSDTPYVHPKSGFMAFMTQPFLFGLPMWIWLIIFFVILLLLILFIILIVKGSKKRKEKKLLMEQKREEQDRLEQEKRAEAERREQERYDREEERRRQQEEREEEKRRKEEEREEEKRRKEEEREEEKRRREDEREEERRRREDERRMAEMNRMNAGVAATGVAMQPQAQYAPPMQQMPQQGYAPNMGYAAPDDAYLRLREYEDRLRSMERELDRRRMETIAREENERVRREMEEAVRARRREEEYMRLRDLQEYEARRREEFGLRYPTENLEYALPSETDNLKLLEEELVQKQEENRLLQEQIKQKYGDYDETDK